MKRTKYFWFPSPTPKRNRKKIWTIWTESFEKFPSCYLQLLTHGPVKENGSELVKKIWQLGIRMYNNFLQWWSILRIHLWQTEQWWALKRKNKRNFYVHTFLSFWIFHLSGLMLQHLGHLNITCPSLNPICWMFSLVALPLGTAPGSVIMVRLKKHQSNCTKSDFVIIATFRKILTDGLRMQGLRRIGIRWHLQ